MAPDEFQIVPQRAVNLLPTRSHGAGSLQVVPGNAPTFCQPLSIGPDLLKQYHAPSTCFQPVAMTPDPGLRLIPSAADSLPALGHGARALQEIPTLAQLQPAGLHVSQNDRNSTSHHRSRPIELSGVRSIVELEPPFAPRLLPSSVLAVLVLDDNRRLNANHVADGGDHRGRTGSVAASTGTVIPIYAEDGWFAGTPAASRRIQLAYEIAGAIALVKEVAPRAEMRNRHQR